MQCSPVKYSAEQWSTVQFSVEKGVEKGSITYLQNYNGVWRAAPGFAGSSNNITFFQHIFLTPDIELAIDHHSTLSTQVKPIYYTL